ncbi:MAG: hypothetical protein ACE5KV_06855, partial [Thermoplasmata archaeon]
MQLIEDAQRKIMKALRLKKRADLLILWNTGAMVPALIYLFLWFLLTFFFLIKRPQLVIYIAAVFLVVISIVSAISLKLRILKDTGDPNLAPVRRIYKSASRINLAYYIVLYPIMLGLYFHKYVLDSIFFLVALFVAIPLLALIDLRKRDYQKLRKMYRLGEHYCSNCGVSLSFHSQIQKWKCFRCGRVYRTRTESSAGVIQ